jgi:hypothetical protein
MAGPAVVLCVIAAVAAFAVSSASATALDDYIALPDPTYSYFDTVLTHNYTRSTQSPPTHTCPPILIELAMLPL